MLSASNWLCIGRTLASGARGLPGLSTPSGGGEVSAQPVNKPTKSIANTRILNLRIRSPVVFVEALGRIDLYRRMANPETLFQALVNCRDK